jgi:hypothetical protein
LTETSTVRVLGLEINDAGIVVAEPSRVLAVEPGYALAIDGTIVTGQAAYAQARVRPRQVSNRYWGALSLESGTSGIATVDTAAELALKSLWQRFGSAESEVLLVVPGAYRREQFGLLLGLAEECGMRVRGFVDAAAAASVRPYPNYQLLHLDAGLHHVGVTALEQGAEVAAGEAQHLADVGLASLVDSWAGRVAELFVLATRFDPFHQAESEQVLYNRLPSWLERLHTEQSVELTLPQGEEELSVVIEREQLLGVAAGFYRALVQLIAQCRAPDTRLVVQVSDRLAALPGLLAELGRLDDAHIVGLAPGQAALGALAGVHAVDAPTGQVKFLRHLPWRESSVASVEATPAPVEKVNGAQLPATHVVYRGIAYHVDAQGLLVGRDAAANERRIVLGGEHSGVSRAHCELVFRDGELKLIDRSRYGTFVNERRVAHEATLRPADVIRIGSPGAELRVIALEQADGT